MIGPRKYTISLFLTGKCDHCRAYSFTSKTEKLRHISLFHRRQKTTGPPKEASFVCADASCGKGFTSAASLSRHKKSTGHKKAAKRRLPSAKKTAKRQLKDAIRQAAFNQSDSESEDEKEEECDAKPCCIDVDLETKGPVWIQCNKCQDWFHIFCINLTESEADKITD